MLPIGVARCVGSSGKFAEGVSLRSPSWISSWLLPFCSELIMNITYTGFLVVWARTFGGRCEGVSISRVCGQGRRDRRKPIDQLFARTGDLQASLRR